MSLSDIVLIALLPALVICLIGAWLVYASRGQRAVKLDLKGFGISLAISSSSGDTPETGAQPEKGS